MAPVSRRHALHVDGATLFIGLAGCSNVMGSSPPAVERIVLRSDTGATEPISITQTHAPSDGSTVQSHHVYEAQSSGGLRIIELDYDPGFYNMHAESQNHGGIASLAFNSHKDGAPSYNLQFEFVVKDNGSLYSNIAKTGEEISIPGSGQ